MLAAFLQFAVEPNFIGVFETTQTQWKDVTGSNPSHYTGSGAKRPVEMITYNDVMNFNNTLKQRVQNCNFKIPRPEEWIVASQYGRGGYETGRSYAQGTYPVGSFSPNDIGLYDMCGNVSEIVDYDASHEGGYSHGGATISPSFYSIEIDYTVDWRWIKCSGYMGNYTSDYDIGFRVYCVVQ